jgi:hypothetical protein
MQNNHTTTRKLLLSGACLAASVIFLPAMSADFAQSLWSASAQSTDHGDDHGSDHAASGHESGGRSSHTGGEGRGKSISGSEHGGGRGSVIDSLRSDESDSDRPVWAGVSGSEGKPGGGNSEPGSKKGDLFGDMYVILRDENGIPILSEAGFVQPIDADGNLVPLDEEGHPLDESLTIEVELGRLNVGRSPSSVLVRSYDEVIDLINLATAVSLDPSGRLVLTVPGDDGELIEKTIDAPLENLALFAEILNTGTLSGVTIDPALLGDLAYLVDGELTTADYAAAASFLAASSDKSGTLTIDEVIYLSAFVGLEGTITSEGESYVDYSDFTYDRTATYQDITTTVLVEGTDGVWTPTEVNVFETVFDSEVYQSLDGGIDGFVQAADDARAVIEFIHEYEVPAEY